MQHYLIKDGQYLISKTILPNSTVVTKRPSTKHHWGGNEWVFTGYTADESMTALRQQRNQLLQQTDWMANSDVTMSEEWRVYRQALRDLPANSTPALDENGKLTNITWPEKPQ
jgi:hypothetical protein